MPKGVPFRRQRRDYTCGPVTVQMVLAYYGRAVPRQRLIERLGTTSRTGTSRRRIVRVLREHGLSVHAHSRWTASELCRRLGEGIPVIVNYREPQDDEGHYAVAIACRNGRIVLHDPWHGPDFSLPMRGFVSRWYGYHRHRRTRWAAAVSR